MVAVLCGLPLPGSSSVGDDPARLNPRQPVPEAGSLDPAALSQSTATYLPTCDRLSNPPAPTGGPATGRTRPSSGPDMSGLNELDQPSERRRRGVRDAVHLQVLVDEIAQVDLRRRGRRSHRRSCSGRRGSSSFSSTSNMSPPTTSAATWAPRSPITLSTAACRSSVSRERTRELPAPGGGPPCWLRRSRRPVPLAPARAGSVPCRPPRLRR